MCREHHGDLVSRMIPPPRATIPVSTTPAKTAENLKARASNINLLNTENHAQRLDFMALTL